MSVFPLLTLEVDPRDSTQVRLTFQPDPSMWIFNDCTGTREQLRAALSQTVEAFQAAAPAGARFDDAAKQRLRSAVLFLLLDWVAHRELLIPKY